MQAGRVGNLFSRSLCVCVGALRCTTGQEYVLPAGKFSSRKNLLTKKALAMLAKAFLLESGNNREIPHEKLI
jgi:hypothetical protein